MGVHLRAQDDILCKVLDGLNFSGLLGIRVISSEISGGECVVLRFIFVLSVSFAAIDFQFIPFSYLLGDCFFRRIIRHFVEKVMLFF